VCIVKEEVGDEVSSFASKYWPEASIYLDEGLTFFKAIAGGQENKVSLITFFAQALNPFSVLMSRVKATSSTHPGNLKGEGLITGGCYVLRQGGDVEYAHLERDIGEVAPVEDVVAAAQRASAK